MPNQNATLDHVFHALADPTRRAVVQQLSRGPKSVTTLAKPFKMALPSFVQHLKVLEDTGLVQSIKKGRVRTFKLAPQSLVHAEHWIVDQRTIWQKRFDQMDAYLRKLHTKEKK
jgi:DNA-binding transcriptional ArsR family regulator